MLACVGLSHKQASIGVRERAAIPADALPARLAQLHKLAGVSEVLLLSTCNRLEIFAEIDERAAATALVESLGPIAGPHVLTRFGREALLHLLRVAASLESMVIGEPQILGQLKAAAALAERLGTTGPRLSRAVARAVSAARRVRTETAIGSGVVSLSGVAVQMARQVLGPLAHKSVLFIGAGQMAQLASREIKDEGAGEIWVANRSAEHAELLASEIGGEPIAIAQLPGFLARADVVVCSSAAPEPVLTREAVASVLPLRRHRPLFIIDLALPRNVEPGVHELEDVHVYDLDDIDRAAALHRSQREGEVVHAETIVAEELESHLAGELQRGAAHVVPRLRMRASAIVEKELARSLSTLGLSASQEKSVRGMAQAIVNKLLHAPTQELREGSSPSLIAAAVRLFGLDDTRTEEASAQQLRRASAITLRAHG